MEHLTLGRPHEMDMTDYECGICGKPLRRVKGPDTKWEWWYFTLDGTWTRHFRVRCNLATPEQIESWKKRNELVEDIDARKKTNQ